MSVPAPEGAPPTLDATKLHPGEFVYVVNAYRVTSAMDTSSIHGYIGLRDTRGNVSRVSGDLMQTEFFSAEQFAETRTVTRTTIADVLRNAGHSVFTVEFEKQVTDKVAADKLSAEDPATLTTVLASPRKRLKFARDLLKGESRKLVGQLVRKEHLDERAEEELGRVKVMDLEIDPSQHNTRLVDTRTIQSLVCEGVKYIVKKK